MKIQNLAILVLVLCALCIGLSVSAYAEIPDPSDCNTAYNLCENCDIETDISDGSWTATNYATVSWSTAQSRSISHSLLVTVTNTTSTYGGTSDCIDLGRTTQSGDYYSAAGYAYVTSDAKSALNVIRIRIRFYENSDCTGNASNKDIDLDASDAQADTWNRVADTIVPPTNRQSAKVRVAQRNSSSTGSVSLYWDDVLFFQSNANSVTIRDFRVAEPKSFPSWTFGLSAAVLLTALSLSALLWARWRR